MTKSISLNVTTETLSKKTGEMETQRKTLTALLDEMKNGVNFLVSQEIWGGEASSTCQNKFNVRYEELRQRLELVRDYTTGLNQAADHYTADERVTDGLSTNGEFH